MLAGLMALAAGAAACACTGTVLLQAPTGSISVAGDTQDCACTWTVEYSAGQTSGAVVINADLDCARGDTLSIYEVLGEPPLASLCSAEGLELRVALGMFHVELATEPDSELGSVALEYFAINTAPELELVGGESPLQFVFGAPTALPIVATDPDNFDTRFVVDIVCSAGISLALPVELPAGITGIDGDMAGAVVRDVRFEGRPSVVTLLFESLMIFGSRLTPFYESLRVSVNDGGNSGVGEPQETSIAVDIGVECSPELLLTFSPANETFSDGPLDYPSGRTCRFLITDVQQLEFVELDLEVRNFGDSNRQCHDELIIYDGTDETAPPITTALNSAGILCGEGSVFTPTIESASGSLFVVFSSDSSVVFGGWLARIVGRVGSFTITYADIAEIGLSDNAIDVVVGATAEIPSLGVFNPPLGEALVTTVSAGDGAVLAIADGLSVVSAAVTVTDALVTITDADPVGSGDTNLVLANLLVTADLSASDPVEVVVTSVSQGIGAQTEFTLVVVPSTLVIRVPDAAVPTGALALELLPVALEWAPALVTGPLTATVSASYERTSLAPSVIEAATVQEVATLLPRVQVVTDLDPAFPVKLDVEVTVDVSDSAGNTASSIVVFAVSPQCKGHHNLTDSVGRFVDRVGSFDDNYENGITCSWSIPRGAILTFVEFSTEEAFDFVRVYAGASADAPLIGEYSGELAPFAVSSDNGFFVLFETDPSSARNGFSADYGPVSTLPGSTVPEEAVRVVGGRLSPLVLRLPDEAAGLDDAEIVEARIEVEAGALVPSDSSGVVVEDQTPDGDGEGLVIDAQGAVPEMRLFLGSLQFAAPETVALIGASIQFDLVPELFQFEIQVIPCDGLQRLTLADPLGSLEVADGSGPQEYTPNLSCMWILTGARAPAVLTFERLDLDSVDCIDLVVVFDPSDPDHPTENLCASDNLFETTIYSHTGMLEVRFFSDSEFQGDGFLATYQTMPSSKWQYVGSIPDASAYQSIALMGGDALVVGGTQDSGTVLAPLLVTLDTGVSRAVFQSSTEDQLPLGRFLSALCAPNATSVAYMYGGQSTSLLMGAEPPASDFWVFVVDRESARGVWSLVGTGSPDWPPGLRGATLDAAPADPDTLVLFGGDSSKDGSAVSGATWLYSVASGAWLAGPDTNSGPGPRYLHGSAADPVAGAIYVYGGTNGAGEQLRDLWRLDEDLASWTLVSDGADGPSSRDSMLLVAFEDELLVSGGRVVREDVFELGLTDTWAFNTTKGLWQLLDGSGTEAFGGAGTMGVFSGRPSFLAVGGRSNSLLTSSIQAFTMALSVSAVEPSFAPVSPPGNTIFSVVGEMMTSCAAPVCLLGGTSSSNGTVASRREATCELPADVAVPGASVSLELLCQGDGARLQASSGILMYDAASVAVVDFDPAEAEPGTPITLTVSGPGAVLDLVQTPVCLFGEGDVLAEAGGLIVGREPDLGTIVVGCRVPGDIVAGPVLVRIALNGQRASAVESPGMQFEVVERTSPRSDPLPVVLVACAAVLLTICAAVGGALWYKKMALYRLASAEAPWLIPFKELEIGQVLGRGAYGVVHEGMFRGSRCAIKMVATEHFTLKLVEDFRAEASLMADLRHPNVVLFMGASLELPNIAIVLEYLALGSLYSLLHNEEIFFTWTEVRRMALDLSKGMNYLHSTDPPILHRDLKSLNVLVDEHFTLKVSDFGVTKIKDSGKPAAKAASDALAGGEFSDVVGSLYWAAPEVLRGGEYSAAADVYSFAVTLWEICFRRDPYDGLDPMLVVLRVSEDRFRMPIGEDAPKDLRVLMERCWTEDPSQRPTFRELCEVLQASTGTGSIGDHSSSMGTWLADEQSMKLATSAQQGQGLFVVVTAVANAVAHWEQNPRLMQTTIQTFQRVVQSALPAGALIVGNRRESVTVLCLSALDTVAFCFDVQTRMMAEVWASDVERTVMSQRTPNKTLFRGPRVATVIGYGTPMVSMDLRNRQPIYEGVTISAAEEAVQSTVGGQVVVPASVINLLPEALAMAATDLDEKRMALYPPGLEERHAVLEVERKGSGDTGWEEVVGGHAQWIVRHEDLTFTKEVGNGSFGSVFQGTWLSTEVGIKKLFRQGLENEQLVELQAEVGIACRLRHPNIVQFLGVCISPKHLCIVMEYVAGGNAYQVFVGQKVHVSKRAKVGVMKGIALGVRYLHALEPPIIHRDLKAKNVMLTESLEVKLTDFGFARVKASNQTMTRCGSAGHMAPEILRGELYGEAADVYSFAVVVWTIWYQREPYSVLDWTSPLQILRAVLRGQRPPLAPGDADDISDLIVRCWDDSPASRPSFAAIVDRLEDIEKTAPATLPPIAPKSGGIRRFRGTVQPQ